MKPPAVFLGFIVTWKCEAFLSRQKAQNMRKLDASEGSNGDGQLEHNTNPFSLPAVGSSSFWDRSPKDTSLKKMNKNLSLSDISNGIKISDETIASRKFQLQYTCKICDTRNSIKVTRIAYRKGIVIARCKGCDNKHLIADNLNWLSGFDYDNGETNIEQYMQNRNEESDDGKEDLVVRVEKEVFDLEKVLHNNQNEESTATSLETDDRLDQWG